MAAAHLGSSWGHAARCMLVVLCGCGGSTVSAGQEGQTGGRTTGRPTSSTGTTSTGMAATQTTEAPWDESGIDFIEELDGGIFKTCYFFGCPKGQKCMPIGAADLGWLTERCAPVVQDPRRLGESCTVEDSALSGIDDCDTDTLCWNVNPDTLEGTCVAFYDNDCEDQALELAHVLLCLPLSSCDLFAQECPEGLGCYVVSGGSYCLPRYFVGVPQGQPCSELTMCAPGLTCQVETFFPGCGVGRCCTLYCSLSSGACDEPEQLCAPLLTNPAKTQEDIGYCSL